MIEEGKSFHLKKALNELLVEARSKVKKWKVLTFLSYIAEIITYIVIGNVVAKTNIIPDDAIRIRVIANSNSEYDQKIKTMVNDVHRT